MLYLAVSFVVTGLVGYHDLDVPDPMYLALDRAGPAVLWAKYLVGFCRCGRPGVGAAGDLMGQVRIFYAMGRDGLLPAAFARVHPRTRTPHIGTIVTGVVSCIAAGLLPLDLLGDVISMGTLLAFGIVCGGVLVLRRTRPDLRPTLQGPRGYLGAAGRSTVLRGPDGHPAQAGLERVSGVAGDWPDGLRPVWRDPLEAAAGRPELIGWRPYCPICPCEMKVAGGVGLVLVPHDGGHIRRHQVRQVVVIHVANEDGDRLARAGVLRCGQEPAGVGGILHQGRYGPRTQRDTSRSSPRPAARHR